MHCARALLLPALLLLLALPVSRGRYNDDFDDGEDLADFDDNDFAEFEDMSDDQAAETETPAPPRASASSQHDEDEDEDEATVELEDGQDGFEDSETQVHCVLACLNIFKVIAAVFSLMSQTIKSTSCLCRIKTYTANMTRRSLKAGGKRTGRFTP